MKRKISWFSCGAASAVATKLTIDSEPVYCDTGAEHADNVRFLRDCERWFQRPVRILKSDEFIDTWDVWKTRRYLAGADGAPCTIHLKVAPRLAFQRPDDIHIFGYTTDASDVARADRMRTVYPEQTIETPLIDRGLTKAACLSILTDAEIKIPAMYVLGFHNNNCVPCVKARGAAYWALMRRHFPEQFDRLARLSRELGVKLVWLDRRTKGFLDELPLEQSVLQPIQPSCDFLCHLSEREIDEHAA